MRGRSSAIVSGIPAAVLIPAAPLRRPATAPATSATEKSGDRTTAATYPAILKSTPSTPDRMVAPDFSQGVFSENFLPRFSGGNSRRKIQLDGWGVQIPVQIFENFSVGPLGAIKSPCNDSDGPATVISFNSLNSTSTTLQQCSLLVALGPVAPCCQNTDGPRFGAPSFRRERSVRVWIVRIIFTRASLPSLKNRRSARSSSSIGRNRSQHVSGTVVHASGVSFGGSVLKAHKSAALHFVVRQALTQAIKIPRSL